MRKQGVKSRKTDLEKMKPIDLMHGLFGKGPEGHTCRECNNFYSFQHNKQTYYKCKVYGATESYICTWRNKWEVCGMFNQTNDTETILKRVNPEPLGLYPLDPQEQEQEIQQQEEPKKPTTLSDIKRQMGVMI